HATRRRQLRALEPSPGGRAVLEDLGDRDAVDAELGAVPVGDQRDADPRLDRPSPGDELRDEAADRVHGDGEADARRGATRAEDRGVDADHPAARVEERPARVPGGDRGVGLDDVADPAAIRRSELAPGGADDADGERVVGPERVADRAEALAA